MYSSNFYPMLLDVLDTRWKLTAFSLEGPTLEWSCALKSFYPALVLPKE